MARRETDTPDWVIAERQDLATVLDGLTPEQWDAPTLCAGWRVREVLAHITMPYRYSMPRFAVEMIKARGNFNRMSDRRARADADALTPNSGWRRCATTPRSRGNRRAGASTVPCRTMSSTDWTSRWRWGSTARSRRTG
ncbi:maleylpyruvate isomerase family mycothiol-dependent enzyme [Rhodococcus opacus]|nr:maleylpyruvate isomerase family mycothiol-dependent enzyme [Rhodococcus opacus]